MAYRRLSSQVVLAAAVVVVGALLLGSTTGLYDTDPLLVYVPSLFVVVGAYAIVASGFRTVFGPLLVITLAGAWQAVALGYATLSSLTALWPLLVIAFGLSLLVAHLRPSVEAVEGGRVDAFALFGGRNQRVTSRSFVGGETTAVFGGTEIDLRDAAIPAPPARLTTTAIFGGVEVVVPRDWNVRLDVLPIFGAAEDARPRRESEHEAVDLVVTGFVAFGGVEVTD
jgi:hypothetical protein